MNLSSFPRRRESLIIRFNIYKMKKLVSVLAISALIVSCGEKKEEKKDGFEMNRTKTVKAEAQEEGVPVDMNNDGVGPFKDITFPDQIDEAMAAAGEANYNACIACHAAETRLIGPALKGVYERRSPAWVMNMIYNASGMLKEDPIAKALLKEYNNAIMTPSGLDEKETREVAEYLRTL